jgi:hypothetical protein
MDRVVRVIATSAAAVDDRLGKTRASVATSTVAHAARRRAEQQQELRQQPSHLFT